MTKISIYNKDTDVRGNDKWIGSDAQNQNRTKNFTPDNVATYFNENQVIDLGVELRYFYDTLDPLQERVYGSITFETEIGPQVNFSAISTFILSKYTMGHTDVSQFLDFLIGSNVILSRSNNINMFGYYKIDNIEPYLPDPNFFVVTLTFESGNGYMKEDEDYFISLIQFEQTIPDVPTRTSDLINDGQDGVHPFITAEDAPTPTLQSVTDQGSITTNSITVDSAHYFSIVEPSDVGTENKNTGSYAYLSGDGILGLKNTMFESDLKNTNVTHAGIVLEFPDKTTGSYTIATTSDIPVVTGFVPYTGATGNVNIGTHNYIGGNITLNGNISGDGGTLNLLQGSTNTIQGDGYSSIYSLGTDSIGFYLANGSDAKQFNLLTDTITLNDTLDYTLPSTSGTIALISDIPSVTGYVPYTGANQNVNLGEYELKAGQLTLDTTPTGTATVGTTRWNDTIGSSETTLKGGTVVLKNGVDLVARVVNKVTPNATLLRANYTAVRVSGAQGQRLAVAYAQANSDANSADTIGVVCENIATNQEGFIMTVGQLIDVNTTGSLQGETWADGDVLYLSPTAAGKLTNIKPTGLTGHIVVVGYVEYSHAIHGSIYIKVMNGWELDELHNVYINQATLANNDGLFYDSADSLWKNKTIASALGFTPVTDARTISTTAPLSGGGDLSANRTLSISQASTTTNGYLSSTDWNTFNNKGSGTVTSVSALTLGTTGTDLSSSVATGTTTPVITLNVPTASATNRGALSSTDWSTFNGKFTLPALTSGSVLFSNGTTIAQSNANLFWDNTNNRLGIGTNAPSNPIHINTSTNLGLRIDNVGSGANSIFIGNSSGLIRWVNGTSIGSSGIYSALNDQSYSTFDGTNVLTRLFIKASTGNVLINTTTDAGYKLDVNGTARVSGQLTLGNNAVIPNGVGGGFYGALFNQNSSPFQYTNTFIFQTSASNSVAVASGSRTSFSDVIGWVQSSGTADFASFRATPTINQTGTATGITRGLYIAPTLTAAADWRAIEVASGITILGASTTAKASLRIPSGTAPTTPTNGDIWFDGTNLKMQIGGVTKTFTLL